MPLIPSTAYRWLLNIIPSLLVVSSTTSCAPHREGAESGHSGVTLTWINDSPRIARLEVHDPLPGAVSAIRISNDSGQSTSTSLIGSAEGKTPHAVAHATISFDPTRVELLDPDGRALRSVPIRILPSRPRSQRPPGWAKGMLWYQIFPERFANGNPENDPTNPSGFVVDWDQDFDSPTIEEIERAWFRGAGTPGRYGVSPDREGGSIASVVFQRRFGGDLQGVLAHQDHLESMNIDGVYLCPIFDSGSLHKYDANDHRHIDPSFGNKGIPPSTPPLLEGDPLDHTTWDWTESDRFFVHEFIPALRERDMRLMLDGVWNHVGLDHWAFRDVREKGSRSRFADWFDCAFDEHGALIAWRAWDGVNGALPIFKHIGEDLAPGPKAHVFEVTKRWMDPNGDGDPSDGIDGWRLDVANEIGKDFWRDWRELVRSINPDALIVGEIWGDAQPWFDGHGFDAQMNYPAAYAIADWLSIGSSRNNAQLVADRLTQVFSHDPEHDQVQLNLMSSHDTERLGSLMENGWVRAFDNGARPWSRDGRYNRDSVSDDAIARAGAAIATLLAAPGSFMLYNGDEFALPGADDPDNRRPIPSSSFDSDDQPMLRVLRELSGVLHDPRYRDVLRYGSARFEAHNQILRVTRQLDETILICDIGPSDRLPDFPGATTTILGPAPHDVTVTWGVHFQHFIHDEGSR